MVHYTPCSASLKLKLIIIRAIGAIKILMPEIINDAPYGLALPHYLPTETNAFT